MQLDVRPVILHLLIPGSPSLILLVFPHQLFAKHPGLRRKPEIVCLVEDSLFFGDPNYPADFHKQKLWLHRTTMKRYQASLEEKGHSTVYLEYQSKSKSLLTHMRTALKRHKLKGNDRKFVVVEPTDFILEKRLLRNAHELGVEIEFLPTPLFLNTRQQNESYRSDKKRWYLADYYKAQRKRLDVLLENDQPVGGKWSFDEDNRKKIPKKLLSSIPQILKIKRDETDEEARQYVENHFGDNPGCLDQLPYPSTHRQAKKWFKHFLDHRLDLFGDYEDAVVQGESWLWHSALTPMLNTGLITPQEVLKATLEHAEAHDVPINSLEGFVRQIIGWREFMRATYEDLGVSMRTTNCWQHHRTMPSCFYDGTTGILPVDDVIARLIKTGYCHHIERLMILGGFMFLCEIDPDDIYLWFMEMFIDSYDWVMVPNVYAMSQHADGGQITTKPYFSGSSYVRKMSHYKSGPWCEIWDGLYWRWILLHHDALAKNARWAMMCSMAKKMAPEKRETHLANAENFLATLA